MRHVLGAAVAVALVLAWPAQPARAQWWGGSSPSEIMGEIKHTACNFEPRGWSTCRGQVLPISRFVPMFSLLSTTFGGDGRTTFALPDVPPGLEAEPDEPLALVCLDGVYPAREAAPAPHVVGLIRLIPYYYGLPEDGWLPCDGRVVDQAQHPDLYAAIRDSYGPSPAQPGRFQLPTLPPLDDGRLRWAIDAWNGESLAGYLGDLRRWPAATPVPDGWLPCDGRNMQLARNQALFALLGTRYGGDGRTTFQLPQLADEAGVRWIVCIEGSFPARY